MAWKHSLAYAVMFHSSGGQPSPTRGASQGFLSHQVDNSFHLDCCFTAVTSAGHRVFLVVALIWPINWFLKGLSQAFNDNISHRQIVWMLPYELGHHHQPHFIISSTWTLISNTWPQWKMRCHPQHGCVHQPAGLAEQHSRASWLALAVTGLHTSAVWTVQQSRTKALSFEVYDTPFWKPCATAASPLSALPSSSRMLMGSWLCRSFRRAQKQIPLLFRHSHFMMDLCKGGRWVEF